MREGHVIYLRVNLNNEVSTFCLAESLKRQVILISDYETFCNLEVQNKQPSLNCEKKSHMLLKVHREKVYGGYWMCLK